jgi:hypothetical protein
LKAEAYMSANKLKFEADLPKDNRTLFRGILTRLSKKELKCKENSTSFYYFLHPNPRQKRLCGIQNKAT